MKKILGAVVIILLVLITFFSYKKYSKLNSPKYSYDISDSIDIDYHDQTIVTDYFVKAKELEAYVRTIWYNHKVNVVFVDEESSKSLKYGNYFNALKAQVTILERKLKKSYLLKAKGFNNKEISDMETQGVSAMGWELIELMNVKYGERSQHVWQLQKKLIEKGFVMPLDGFFRNETLQALSEFEKSVGMYPSGKINRKMLLELYK